MVARTPARSAKGKQKAPLRAPRRPRLPSKPTPAQRKAAAALSLTPKQQKTAWKTTSTASPRLLEAHARLDRQMRRLFPGVEPTFDYNMRGWKVLRRRQVTEWKGTMDPNWVRIYIAERKQGVTVHAWDPFDPTSLQKHAPRLAKAGFKAMVGCLQYNRTGPVPVEALGPLLESMAKAWKAERAG